MKKTLLISALSLTLLPITLATAEPAERNLRYRPEGTDFVIDNGKGFFNRPLYGGNSGFRIEAGDRPEFAFHLPGRGGNLRLGILPKNGQNGIWIFDAKSIVTRYRPGSMVYEIRDPQLGSETLIVTGIAAANGEGLVVRAELAGTGPSVRLVWAFGGSDGNKGQRNGDLNAEKEPLEYFFQFTPERCKGSRYELRPAGFTFTGKPGKLHGLLSTGTKPALADAAKWLAPDTLLASTGTNIPVAVVTDTFELSKGVPFHLVILRNTIPTGDPSRYFSEAETHRRSIAERVTIRTPDPFINAATAAINVAADAIWDEGTHTYMHGAVGWRVPLLGWRGPYAGDALGNHERTRRHIEGFAAKQISTEPPAQLPRADEKYFLARSETALNSRGNFSGNFIPYYDMNTVAVDAMFRHLLWTGDRVTAGRFWPVLMSHLEWQKRLFRRPFPDGSSPLYEAYACIWASDQLMYSGGGATHSSAYQVWHNRMAARLAVLLGKDPSPFEREADAIARTMRRELWLTDRGWFAECKDYLGLKLVHPDAALWSYYHTIDSDAATPMEAWQMSRFVDTGLKKIPVRVKGVAGPCFQLPTSNWHPYMWSINNVAFAESAHTSLALWQTGRNDLAWPLMKGALLESMFLGPCPGNVGMTTPSDVFSMERYRDFADGAGISARAIVEGLFGLRPDRIAGEIVIRPGFPASWDKASIRHPDVDFAFKREALTESYAIDQRFDKPMTLRLQIPALRDSVAKVTVNGMPAKWLSLPDTVGHPRVEIIAPQASTHRVVIVWSGDAPAEISTPALVAEGLPMVVNTGIAKIVGIEDPQGFLKGATVDGNRIKAKAAGVTGHRTAFVKLRQGDLAWWGAVESELRPPLEIVAQEDQDREHLRFRVLNHTLANLSGECHIFADGRPFSQTIRLQAGGESDVVNLPADSLVPGSHRIIVETMGGTKVDGLVTNWKLTPPRSPVNWDAVDLTGRFNDSVTSIFSNEYRSPRSPFCSLAIPKHGIGGWCVFNPKVEIDDAGLRKTAAHDNGVFQSSIGVPFKTPGSGTGKNILFVSQWDNYPRTATVPLSGKATRACLLMAGSTNPMQSRMRNGEVVVTYADGNREKLSLDNPTTWWPIDQDYYIDDFAFARHEPAPPRLDLKTGKLRIMEPREFKSKTQNIPGGAATVLDLPLDGGKELRSITVSAIANDVVIGLMAVSLAR